MNIKISPNLHGEIVEKYVKLKMSCYRLSIMYNVSIQCISRIIDKYNAKRKTIMPRKYTFNESFFKKIDNEEKAYFLGLLYADGYNRFDNAAVVIQLQESDKYMLEIFAKKLEFTGNILLMNKRKQSHQNQSRLELNSRELCDDLNRQGCIQKKSLILKFPTEEQVPKHLINHFIRGYFDGDGSLYKSKDNKVSVALTGSKDFCLGFLEYIKNNFKFNVGIHNYLNSKTKDIRISSRGAIQFLDWIYNNCNIKLNRKYDKFLEIINFYKQNINPNRSGGSNLDINNIILKYAN